MHCQPCIEFWKLSYPCVFNIITEEIHSWIDGGIAQSRYSKVKIYLKFMSYLKILLTSQESAAYLFTAFMYLYCLVLSAVPGPV